MNKIEISNVIIIRKDFNSIIKIDDLRKIIN